MPVLSVSSIRSVMKKSNSENSVRKGILNVVKHLVASRVAKDTLSVADSAETYDSAVVSDLCSSSNCSAECSGCFHNSCANCSPHHPCQRGAGVSASSSATSAVKNTPTHLNPVAIEKWSSRNVLEWMASINLIGLVEIFKAKNVTGRDLLSMDADKLTSLGVGEAHLQEMLLLGIQRLCADEGGVAGSPWPHTCGVGGGHSASEHQLKPASFCTLVACHVCSCYLVGADHQGLVCLECGLVVHRQCAAQPSTLPSCDHDRLTSADTDADSMFGTDLVRLFRPGSERAPHLLTRCLSLLERRCQLDASINCHQLYESCCISWNQLLPLRKALQRDAEPVDLELFETSHVVSLVKKFLTHLANPVLPTQMYAQLLSLAHKYMGCGVSGEARADVAAFIAQLPVHHERTLHLVASHLCRLCRMQQQRSAPCRPPPTQLVTTFSFLLIRPPFDQITQWPERTLLHAGALELLLMSHEWDGPSFPETDPPPALPPRPTRAPSVSASQTSSSSTLQSRRTVPMTSSVSSSQTEECAVLQRADWYWGNISREEVSELLAGRPDGTFLVRDSHTAGGEYTLTLRKAGNNRLIRIFRRNGLYGFSEPCQFDSVVSLVEHYRTVSLRDYNAQLDVKLELPLVEPRQYGDKYSTSELLNQLSEMRERHVNKLLELDSLEKHRTVLAERLAVQRKAREAFTEVLHMLHEQQQLQRRLSHKAQLHETSMLSSNSALLESRVSHVQQALRQVEDEVRRQTSYCRTTEHELCVLRQEQRRLDQQWRELERELVRRGVRRECIDVVLEHPPAVAAAAAGEVPESDVAEAQLATDDTQNPWPQHYWLLDDCDRGRAHQLLTGRPDGTFLVRRRANGQLALSIVSLGQVQHCCIVHTERGLGFSSAHAHHASLAALVRFYHDHELSEHNQLLPVTLAQPVLFPHSPSAS